MTKMDRNILGMVLLMASTTASAQVALPTTEKATYTRSLSGQWDFKYIAGSSAGSDSLFFMPEYDTGAWKTIKVPGNWELQGFAGMTYGKKVRAGLGLYRRTIDIPAEWDGRGIYLCLEGVNFGYTLYVDGHEAGSFNSSYNRQTFDITRFAQPGHTHTLAVRVDTRPRGFEFDTNDDWSLSGISRDVLLFALPKVHIDDITIHTSMDGRVDIEALVAGKGKKDKTVIEGEITDAEGNRVASLASAATTSARHRAAAGVPQPHLWTAETPYLYTVSLRLKLNGQTVQTYNGKVGIREIAWDGGIYRINGRPVKFHGATHHDLSPVNGRSITDEEMKRDLHGQVFLEFEPSREATGPACIPQTDSRHVGKSLTYPLAVPPLFLFFLFWLIPRKLLPQGLLHAFGYGNMFPYAVGITGKILLIKIQNNAVHNEEQR